MEDGNNAQDEMMEQEHSQHDDSKQTIHELLMSHTKWNPDLQYSISGDAAKPFLRTSAQNFVRSSHRWFSDRGVSAALYKGPDFDERGPIVVADSPMAAIGLIYRLLPEDTLPAESWDKMISSLPVEIHKNGSSITETRPQGHFAIREAEGQRPEAEQALATSGHRTRTLASPSIQSSDLGGNRILGTGPTPAKRRLLLRLGTGGTVTAANTNGETTISGNESAKEDGTTTTEIQQHGAEGFSTTPDRGALNFNAQTTQAEDMIRSSDPVQQAPAPFPNQQIPSPTLRQPETGKRSLKRSYTQMKSEGARTIKWSENDQPFRAAVRENSKIHLTTMDDCQTKLLVEKAKAVASKDAFIDFGFIITNWRDHGSLVDPPPVNSPSRLNHVYQMVSQTEGKNGIPCFEYRLACALFGHGCQFDEENFMDENDNYSSTTAGEAKRHIFWEVHPELTNDGRLPAVQHKRAWKNFLRRWANARRWGKLASKLGWGAFFVLSQNRLRSRWVQTLSNTEFDIWTSVVLQCHHPILEACKRLVESLVSVPKDLLTIAAPTHKLRLESELLPDDDAADEVKVRLLEFDSANE
ncbi:uncharacterized protein K452DRAFT_299146 [Aplosporella prunicola CBS 121167]|uniref:Uncharacterized protein n=1 Tax=Aplosporella prunicola CBS 121167 TaxID=1176127 RepID=A0A6A6BA01_9PEZI|nr:uncharacterized protein K452DRAFT_299146 [Aplosporella prunicola CBS 121167]KAF2141102.1 hypothetical protein K452DRAFT_299146 [Aplosporella prunicola CBS 121167]